MPNMGNNSTETYQEFDYPHVLPVDDPLHMMDTNLLDGLTPLEKAFVRWVFDVGVPSSAMEMLIHPAHFFDLTIQNHQVLLNRKTVLDKLGKIKVSAPYVTLYTSDHILSILHGEIQHLRKARRSTRFSGPNADETYLMGKKSRHEEELLEMDMLLKFIQLAKEVTTHVGPSNPQSGAGGENRSVDRVLAEVEKLIDGREAGTGVPPETGI
jgi:hypothetical protein